MIRMTRLLRGSDTIGKAIMRHSSTEVVSSDMLAFSEMRRPVVFWNLTTACNLSCRQCYISAGRSASSGELTISEARSLIDDLSEMKVPLLLISGGEPLMRPDFWDIITYSKDKGMNLAISSNGTLITDEVARRLNDLGVEYVGISLDGATERTHDRIRGEGSFSKAVEALKHCVNAGLKSGVRMTVTQDNYSEVPQLLGLTEELEVPRFCLYWLVPSGRGRNEYASKQLSSHQVSELLDLLYQKAKEIEPDVMEVLTVDAPQDGAYLVSRLRNEGSNEYENALRLLECTGDSCSAGDRVANIDPQGNVYPCQFAQIEELKIGSVKQRRFSEMWNDPSNEVLASFRSKKARLTGNCERCSYKGTCGGGCRMRAYFEAGDLWASDSFCSIEESVQDESVLHRAGKERL